MAVTLSARPEAGGAGISYFLTAMDPRAKLKGSRDGLGGQAIWAAAARPLIGNLTTVTSSLRGFTTLLTGLRLAELALVDPTSEARTAPFLVWEQMAGYARHVCLGHRSFFGLQRIAARVAAVKGAAGRVVVSADPEQQILGNQRTDGVLGNYTAPARVSGLLMPGTPARLTPEAAAFVDDEYLPRLATGWGFHARNLVRVLRQDSTRLDLRPNPQLEAIASVFDARLTDVESGFYRRHLVNGGPSDPTQGRQGRLVAVLEPRLAESEPLSRQRVERLADDADSRGYGDVSGLLRDIVACESVLAPATALFSYVLGRDGDRVTDIATDVRDAWGQALDSIHDDAVSVLPAGHWHTIAAGLAAGDYEGVVVALAGRNEAVMRDRGGAAPWLGLTNGRVRVRFRGEDAGHLPDGDEIRALWWYPYFIPSLRAILASLRDGDR